MTHETTREAVAARTLDRPAAHPTEEALAGLLAELLGGDPGRYAPDTELFGSLPELDSLALVELITAIEERFGFELDEDDITAEVFGTVESLAAHVDACTA
ncbi:acyl carrier protein [Nocardioides ganghwensis]|jgi:acyl carrier protein|uniref:Acyl carrier protein n=1 Tax=Nocardioides ganghwensis TaxID=252230 RepID=A0A4Q2S7V6_9ACTN|nr:phosphopantetheine-binding protein [Nocardioides ganghwensis]MBD3944196.1 acyl carrier protein [Nocardioides ganghwensis]RYB99133.1 acyl carrier protein [Nocardioides ganghwensis]